MYKTTIRYGKNIVTFNVHSIKLSGSYMLPDFLKHVRLIHGHGVETVHQITDTPVEECLLMEEGKINIPKNYLQFFAYGYKLPKKIMKLGINPDEENRFELPDRLYQLRINSNRTQMDVACTIDVARTTYAGYETGQNEPDLKTIIKLADLYKVPLDYLVGRKF